MRSMSRRDIIWICGVSVLSLLGGVHKSYSRSIMLTLQLWLLHRQDGIDSLLTVSRRDIIWICGVIVHSLPGGVQKSYCRIDMLTLQ